MLSKRNIILALLLILVASRFFDTFEQTTSRSQPDSNAFAVTEAFQKQQSDIQVEGSGTIAKILPDDLKGSRHQRIILQISSGHTVLIAHNIDLAPRIPDLQQGDTLRFFGEYEWNEKGGVIHWTHHDPKGRHIAGWLQHNNQIYQ